MFCKWGKSTCNLSGLNEHTSKNTGTAIFTHNFSRFSFLESATHFSMSGVSRICAAASAARTHIYPVTRQSTHLFVGKCGCAWQLVQRKTNATRIRAINFEYRARTRVCRNELRAKAYEVTADANVIAELVNNFTQRHALARRHLCRQLTVLVLSPPPAVSRGGGDESIRAFQLLPLLMRKQQRVEERETRSLSFCAYCQKTAAAPEICAKYPLILASL